jgi:phosphotransferase system HPr-like phosphotransfer protein
MKKFSLNAIFLISLFACSGCVSTSISDALAAIQQEDKVANNRAVNKKVLMSIQALRGSENLAQQSFTFAYNLDNKELNVEDKNKVVSLVVDNNQTIIISIAPAKEGNNFEKLALSISRAEVLRGYLSHFSNKVTIKFDPKLTTNTINLVTGA